MRRVDALVAEDSPDFVDALETGDDQALQVQFGRDTQLHRLVEGVAMRDERPRRRATRDVQQRRGFDLVKTAAVDEPAHLGDQAAAHDHRIAHVGIDDHIDVALAIALLDVLQPMPLVRQRHQRLTERGKGRDVKRQLAQLRAKHVAAHAEKIATVEIAPVAEGALSNFFLTQVNLQLSAAVGKVGEARLAHRSFRKHAAGDAPAFGARILARNEKTVTLEKFGGRSLNVKAPRCKRIVPPRTQSGQILTSGRYERRFGFSEFVQ